jgi:formylglycine-generating enzyme required for sulfatase activity
MDLIIVFMMCGANVCNHLAVFNGAMKLFIKDDVYRKMRLYNFPQSPVAPLLIAALSIFSFGHANAQSVYINMGKGWSYITGAQRAVNDSNRVNYLMGMDAPFGRRVDNFREMENYYNHDTQFLDAHLLASQVYESEKMVEGPSFFISKTEVTNAEYRQFVEYCIAKWMKENRPEIAQKYKWESPEYVQAVQGWLASNQVTSAVDGAIQSAPLQSPAANWGELYMKKLDWKKISYEGVSVFPNTNSWVMDFPYSYNEPMKEYYFVHPAYVKFPVVGVSNSQAKLYCSWYTLENAQKEKEVYEIVYRLPTETEWERAASVVAEKRSKKSSGSPVYNDFLRNGKGCYIANFRPVAGNFGIDGAIYATAVESYFPNDAGCYNMQGNVAEWTSTGVTYRVGEYTQEGEIIKGGSWNLPEAACTIGSRGIIFYGVAGEEPATSYVGFRMVAVPMKKFRPTITPQF